MNLWTDELRELNEAGLRDFLQLASPVDARPAEGIRLDFKSEWKSDLGRTVAALANTEGGIVIFGVTADADNSEFPADLVGVNWPDEAELRISNHIASTVRLIPRFEVVSVLLSTSKRAPVLRVSPGPDYPYTFRRGEVDRVHIRRGSKSVEPSREELLAVVGRCSAEMGASDVVRIPDDFNVEDDEGQFIRAAASVGVVPIGARDVLIDAQIENGFRALLERHVAALSRIPTQVRRAGGHYEFISASRSHDALRRKWRLRRDGAVFFSTTLEEPSIGQPGWWSAADAIFSTVAAVKMGLRWNREFVTSASRVGLCLAVCADGLRATTESAYEGLPRAAPFAVDVKTIRPANRDRTPVTEVVTLHASTHEFATALGGMWTMALRDVHGIAADGQQMATYVAEFLDQL